jgi:MFS family permease
MAIVQSSWAVGYALAALTAGVILRYTTWRWVFFVGVLPALVTSWIQRRVPEPEIWKRHHEQTERSRIDLKPLWAAVLPRLVALLAMNTFGMFAWWGLFTWIPAYLALPLERGGRGFNSLDFTTFLTLLNLCGMLPGYLLFGVLADRFGRKRAGGSVGARLCNGDASGSHPGHGVNHCILRYRFLRRVRIARE